MARNKINAFVGVIQAFPKLIAIASIGVGSNTGDDRGGDQTSLKVCFNMVPPNIFLESEVRQNLILYRQVLVYPTISNESAQAL